MTGDTDVTPVYIQDTPMRYIVIRNLKSDKLTLHSHACTVVLKHFGIITPQYIEDAASDTIEEAKADVAFHGTKVKICNCAK